MLPSLDKIIKNPKLEDVGYKLHIELLEYFQKNDIPFTVLDSKRVLENPKVVLSKLCEFIDIPFEKCMLSWKAQQLQEDGIWAKYWYSNVHKSTGFIKYRPKEEPFPEHLKPLYQVSNVYYQKLLKYAL